jgi:hypothetical protein
MKLVGTYILLAGLCAAQTHWVATWGAAPTPGGENTQFNNQTLREIVHVSLGGNTVRLRPRMSRCMVPVQQLSRVPIGR